MGRRTSGATRPVAVCCIYDEDLFGELSAIGTRTQTTAVAAGSAAVPDNHESLGFLLIFLCTFAISLYTDGRDPPALSASSSGQLKRIVLGLRLNRNLSGIASLFPPTWRWEDCRDRRDHCRFGSIAPIACSAHGSR